MAWIDFLLTPLRYPFMLRGLFAAVLTGVVCATVGTYVILRGMAFFGDALAHSILPGVAVGYLITGGDKGPLFWWGTGTAIVVSLGIGAISKGARIKEDTAIGIIFAGMFALGIAIISTVQSYTVDLTHFLFGDILGVSGHQLWLIGLFGGGIILLVLVFYKEFLVLTFDPILAATLRMPSTALEYLQLILIALAIAVSLQTVGVALMMAMLVTPSATAYLLTKRLPVMMILASTFASISGVIGLYLSYYANVASGPAIVLTATAFFVLAWAGKIVKQSVRQSARRRK
ncbi:MAG: Manganese transport system membrane protein MntB [Chloroflexi bacterium]|nr:Manganese transport system membrane protein MntB [Chloroflexota bacterium]